MSFATAWPAVAAAFLSSFVEVVEAFTIVLAVGTFQGWRPAFTGTAAGLALLALLVLVFGPLLAFVPIHALQFVVGVLLLLFGMRWLRKAILRAAGLIPLHDEMAAFAQERAQLQEAAHRQGGRQDLMAAVAAFKAVLLEGLEVVFIVIATGAKPGLLVPASLGALAAGVIAVGIGLAVHKPLTQVPENSLKFAVGVILTAFGVFWTGEGLGIPWPGEDLAIVAFGLIFLLAGLALASLLRGQMRQAAR